MQLNRFSDFALRVLIYLGANGRDDGELVSVQTMAETYGVSVHHLAKVVQRLVAGGFVETRRGPRGGARLARPPGDIRIGDIVRLTEADSALVECFAPQHRGACVIEPACALRPALAAAQEAFFATLDTYTLADMLGPRERLKRVLQLI